MVRYQPHDLNEIFKHLIREVVREVVAEEAPAILAKAAPPAPPASEPANEPLLVSVKRAAFLLGLNPKTLYRMRDAGKITIAKKFGRALVPMTDIKRIVAEASAATNDNPKQKNAQLRKRPKKVKLYPRDG